MVYHVWANGQWLAPLFEFNQALADTGFDGPLSYGIVGDLEKRDDVMSFCDPKAQIWEWDEGNEYLTINRVREWAEDAPSTAVLYAHTKGAATVGDFRDRWRQSMTARLVERWQENLAVLETGKVDAVGCHWLTEALYPGMFAPQMSAPAMGSGFFGGNFWMATCAYLRTLPPCEAEPRWRAEEWIGLGCPRVVDLLPGWPNDRLWPELCV